MITHYPANASAGIPPPTETQSDAVPGAVRSPGSWRYSAGRSSRILITCAAVISGGLHAGIFFGFRHGPKKPKAVAKEEFVIRLTPPPPLKELEEPDTVADSDAPPPPDLGMLVPMQQDLPQLPQPQDFVQQLNFASLIEQPDFSKVSVYVIPENIRNVGKISEKIGRIFNPEDLDRVPQPVLQPAPVYPISMKREAITGTVSVEFIVDVNGTVLNPFVLDSTNHGFDDAAITGVLRWKFKPGIRDGKKVNTRIRVPIVFKTIDPEI